jgi:hypothetical protein
LTSAWGSGSRLRRRIWAYGEKPSKTNRRGN